MLPASDSGYNWSMGSLLLRNRGQVALEYILAISIVVVVVGTLTFGLRETLYKFWIKLTDEITAPCPGCVPPDRDG